MDMILTDSDGAHRPLPEAPMTRTRRSAQPDPHRAAAARPVDILRANLAACEARGDARAIQISRLTLAAYEAREAQRVADLAACVAVAS